MLIKSKNILTNKYFYDTIFTCIIKLFLMRQYAHLGGLREGFSDPIGI